MSAHSQACERALSASKVRTRIHTWKCQFSVMLDEKHEINIKMWLNTCSKKKIP